MQGKRLVSLGVLVLSALLLVSCSKKSSQLLGSDDADAQARGLGSFSRFGGQEAGEVYTTNAPHNQVYLFAYDTSAIAAKYLPSMEAQASYLKEHPSARVLLAGHTDERGSREYNVALGERRANTVRDKLREEGVRNNQIRVVSYGKERPANEGHDESDHRQNRRVEFIYEVSR